MPVLKCASSAEQEGGVGTLRRNYNGAMLQIKQQFFLLYSLKSQI